MQILSLKSGLGTRDFLQLHVCAVTLTAGSCMREKWMVLAWDLTQSSWWGSLCLREVVPGLSLVRAGVGRNNPSSSSRGWLHYLLGFTSGKKGSWRGSGPRQWVPALSSSLDTAVIGESKYDWATVFYRGLLRLCYFETPAPSCTDPSSWPLL